MGRNAFHHTSTLNFILNRKNDIKIWHNWSWWSEIIKLYFLQLTCHASQHLKKSICNTKSLNRFIFFWILIMSGILPRHFFLLTWIWKMMCIPICNMHAWNIMQYSLWRTNWWYNNKRLGNPCNTWRTILYLHNAFVHFKKIALFHLQTMSIKFRAQVYCSEFEYALEVLVFIWLKYAQRN